MFNAAFKKYALLRQQVKGPTLFNTLAPLLNPLRPKRQVIGVYHPDLLHPVAQMLALQGTMHSMVVYGEDGLDELSINAPSQIVEIKQGQIREYQLDPQQLGLNKGTHTDLKGGNAEDNAHLIQAIFANEIAGQN